MARVENAYNPTTTSEIAPLISTTPSEIAPLIIDLGKKRAKRVKQLRKGSGKLFVSIMATVDELKTAGTIAKNAQPVIIVVTEKAEGLSRIPLLGL
jgi:hypothetical protein